MEALKSLSEIHRIELEGVKAQLEEVNINYLLKQALEEITTKSKEVLNKKNITVTSNISSKLPTASYIDKNNVLQALKIVVDNALRFSHENGTVIVSGDVAKQNDNEFINIKVEDFGVGISEEHLNIILDDTLAEELRNEAHSFKKPSLKLTQAKMKLEASGGKIDIASVRGQGTTVTLKIPLIKSTQTSLNTQNELLMNLFYDRKVLLMEDDVLTQVAEKKLLEECGCRVDVVSLGVDAISLAKKTKYDAIFLDITVPDINGLEVMKIIKTIDPNVSVIAITSHVSEQNQEYFQDEGFDTVLTKPVNSKKLKDIVKLIFNNNDN